MTEQLTEDQVDVAPEEAPQGPIRVAWAPVPKVNLLPIEILEGRRFRRTQALLGGAVLGAVLLAAGGTFWAQQGINDANDELTSSQARVSSLTAEQARYATVPQVIAEVEAANTARTLAMGTDVLWYRYLNEVDGARPNGLKINSLTFTLNGSSTVPGSFTDPLTPNGTGTLSVQGTADQYDEVATWMESLNKITGLSAAKLTNASKDETGVVTFGSGGVLDSDALSGRYDKKAG